MSKKKQLNEKELENVTGGEEMPRTTNNVVAKYKDTDDGLTLTHDLGRFEIAYAETNGEAMAKTWCSENNKIYAGYFLADLVTNNYETRILLDTVKNLD